MQVAIAEQLRRRGIEVVTVRDLDALGGDDLSHLERATQMGCVLCTHDADYLDIAMSGKEHAGIIFGRQLTRTISEWVAFLELVHGVYDAEDMRNSVEYVKSLQP